MPLTVLGIETSCDETAAALVRLDTAQADGPGQILSNIVLSQTKAHASYGGVVPEIAARSHITSLDIIIHEALQTANYKVAQLDAIAATAGPGLIGGLMVGMVVGKTLALASHKPFLAINHLEAHALTVRLTQGLSFPYLLLLISGGHCQLVSVEKLGDYILYGSTLDDAPGEAFDKAAKLLGLGYPGGPAVEEHAKQGTPIAIDLPRPLTGDGGCDFSFSGLKTALRHRAKALEPVAKQQVADLAASFQTAIADCLCERTQNAFQRFQATHKPQKLQFVVAGGVAANQLVRQRLGACAEKNGFTMHIAPAALCTDNAAMIAWAGAERLRLGQNNGSGDKLDMAARARWALTDLTPPL
ncbi:MAG: tRNA (adenosine(37)-N6)-threonylcarbamoyltransferase complex transferase subunit TsaD [Alphaproteobacteria bacterium]|nr:tRNA (adenosine(37)-N6)-threonylcarbamoyltransferase complex transferase subunit TsaD [Alphaproteobacteria bacterium]